MDRLGSVGVGLCACVALLIAFWSVSRYGRKRRRTTKRSEPNPSLGLQTLCPDLHSAVAGRVPGVSADADKGGGDAGGLAVAPRPGQRTGRLSADTAASISAHNARVKQSIAASREVASAPSARPAGAPADGSLGPKQEGYAERVEPFRSLIEQMPSQITFIDVETTGFGADDRVVSFAAAVLQTPALLDGLLHCKSLSLIFNPGRRSHPRARQVHGLDDWTLSHQPSFEEHAEQVRDFLTSGDLLVGHNLSFDLRFINAEMARCGLSPVQLPAHCTMEECRQRFGEAALDGALARYGLARKGETHSAREDALLTLLLFLQLRGVPVRAALNVTGSLGEFENCRPVPRKVVRAGSARHSWDQVAEHRRVCRKCGLAKITVAIGGQNRARFERDGIEIAGKMPACSGGPVVKASERPHAPSPAHDELAAARIG